MMTTNTKQEIRALVIRERDALGTMKSAANKAGVSEATISQIINDNLELISDKMWYKISEALGYRPTGWQLVETTNTRVLRQVFEDAKANSMFMAVAHRAGSGKTISGRAYATENALQGVYFLQAREWSRRQFLAELCRVLGVGTGPAHVTTEEMVELVSSFFIQRAALRPLLIIDEADKLKADALRVLIPLYNSLEDVIGMVVMGTDNLQRQVEIGVQWNKKGFDELHSRFGRNFVHLFGATLADVRSICEANGIQDNDLIRDIFKEAGPRQQSIGGQFVQMVEDLRRVKRAVLREVIKLQQQYGKESSYSGSTANAGATGSGVH